MTAHPIIVGITGASGAVLALRTVEALQARQREALVVCSAAGAVVWQAEVGSTVKAWLAAHHVRSFGINDIAAPIASGTFPTGGMAIVPCSMNTAAGVAHGIAGNLLGRAADVTLKEGRPLVVVPREVPFGTLHLENLLKLSQLGARIIPPLPHFYAKPTTVDEVVDHIVGRILVALGVDDALPSEQQYNPEVRQV